MYSRPDWTLFRSLDGLAQVAGVPLASMRRLIAKELTDNALDACGQCEVGLLGDDGFFVQDMGPGIAGAAEDIAALFSIKRGLQSSKLERLPRRGAMGNGLRVVAGAVLASRGTLVVSTRGSQHSLHPTDQGETIVASSGVTSIDGTRIEVTLGSGLPRDSNVLYWANTAIRLAACRPPMKNGPRRQ